MKSHSVWARAWFGTAVAVSAACLVVTFFADALDAMDAPLLLRSFSLRGEMSIGAWWSGMLLLLAAAHSSDGYFLHRQAAPRRAYAWAALSLTLLCLSADEVASLHERIGDTASLLPFLPFGLVLGGVWVFSMTTLWRIPEERVNALWSALAFCLVASVAGQEFLEHNSEWWGEHAALRLVVEEGTELVALLILLRVSMSQSGGAFQSAALTARPVFQALESWRTPIAVATLVTSPVLAALTVMYREANLGQPVLWLAASSFMLAALAIARESLTRRTLHSIPLVLGTLCVALSAAAVALSPGELPRRSQLLTTGALLAIWSLWHFAATTRNREALTLLSAIGAAMLALTWVERSSLTLTFTAYAIAGASVLYGHAFLGAGARLADGFPAGTTAARPSSDAALMAAAGRRQG